jgi:hypothetical protein
MWAPQPCWTNNATLAQDWDCLHAWHPLHVVVGPGGRALSHTYCHSLAFAVHEAPHDCMWAPQPCWANGVTQAQFRDCTAAVHRGGPDSGALRHLVRLA